MAQAVPLQKAWLQQRHPDEVPQKAQEPAKDDRITAIICEDSGMLATPRCPKQRKMTFLRGEEPTERCPLDHSSLPSPSEDATSTETPAPSEPPTLSVPAPVEPPAPVSSPTPLPHRLNEPTGVGTPAPVRLSEPRVSPTPPATEQARVCVDSGLLASPYCPEVVIRSFAAGKAPRKRCHLHRPPPGEE